MLQQKVMETPPPLRSIRPEIPESLERVVMKALAPDVDARPGSMAEWLDQLEEVRRELDQTRILAETLAATNSSASAITGNEVYDVFISYRRQTSSEAARLIRSELLSHKLRVFLDVEELGAGHFDTALLQCIARTPNFIVVLAPNSLERCRDENDWLRQEIVQAINNRKHIIPVTMPGFDFPPAEQLPSEMSALQLHQRVRYDHDYFDAMIDRILRYLRTNTMESK